MIVAAAIRRGTEVYSLPKPNRHHNVIYHMITECGVAPPVGHDKDDTQGFVTDTGEFLTRRLAAMHAYECGQIDHKLNELYSEDVW